ncbi:MAG: GGDEF domain-containing protein [Actinomycetota bacterium]
MRAARPATSRGPRLVVLLIGLALIPLVGVGSVAWTQYDSARSSRDLADQISTSMDELAQLEAVRLALVDERLWNIAHAGTEEIGLPFDLVRQLAGLDVEEQRDRARTEVDVLLADGIGAPFADDALTVRDGFESPGWRTQGPVHEALDDRIADQSSAIRRSLLTTANGVAGAGDVIVALRVSETASDARIEFTFQVLSYLRIAFADFFDTDPEVLVAAGERDRVGAAIGTLDELLLEQSTTRAALDELLEAPDFTAFDSAWVAVVEQLIAGGEGEATFDDAVQRLNAAGATITMGAATFDDFERLTAAATDDVERAGADVAAAGGVDFRNTMVLLVVLVAIAVAIAAAITRYIARPMTRLAAAAERLGLDDELSIERNGPAEVRDVADALRRAATGLARVERLEHQASHDGLTGVPTRERVLTHLERALVRQQRAAGFGAFAFVDIDHFKDVNDRLGHQVGDHVLITIAERLAALLGPSDTLGRYGGDEFVIVLESIESIEQAKTLADRMVAAVSEPIELGDLAPEADARTVTSTVSIGIAPFGEDPVDCAEIVRLADAATYAAKQMGRDRAVLAPDTLLVP